MTSELRSFIFKNVLVLVHAPFCCRWQKRTLVLDRGDLKTV